MPSTISDGDPSAPPILRSFVPPRGGCRSIIIDPHLSSHSRTPQRPFPISVISPRFFHIQTTGAKLTRTLLDHLQARLPVKSANAPQRQCCYLLARRLKTFFICWDAATSNKIALEQLQKPPGVLSKSTRTMAISTVPRIERIAVKNAQQKRVGVYSTKALFPHVLRVPPCRRFQSCKLPRGQVYHYPQGRSVSSFPL